MRSNWVVRTQERMRGAEIESNYDENDKLG